MARPQLVRLLRWGVAVVVLVFVWRSLSSNWAELRTQPVAWTLRPVPAVGSLLLVWVMYAGLIEAWRSVLGGWGERIGRLEAARIWTVSSLGKYVPGKVWAIAGMALMAREAGVAAWAATASAVILQLLAVGTGALAGIGGGIGVLGAVRPDLVPLFWLAGVAVAAGMALVAYPPAMRSLLQTAGLPPAGRTPGGGVLLGAVGANLVAWVGYGLAFWLMARAVVPQVVLPPGLAIAAFAASYVAGLVALFAPGGLVVREGLLVALLEGSVGIGAAVTLALASRVLLTIAELGAAAPFLVLHTEKPRVT